MYLSGFFFTSSSCFSAFFVASLSLAVSPARDASVLCSPALLYPCVSSRSSLSPSQYVCFCCISFLLRVSNFVFVPFLPLVDTFS